MPGIRSYFGQRSKDREARILRTTLNLPAAAGGGITDHGALTGLGDDDHANYVHLTAARTILAQHSFSPSTPQAPFLLGANAQSQLVTGLRADQLDKDVIAGSGLITGGTLTADVTIALGTPSTLTIATGDGVTATSHTHAITSSAAPGAAASLLASDASGHLQLVRLGLGITPSYPFHIQNTSGPQVRISDNASDHLDIEVDSNGDAIMTPSGADFKVAGRIRAEYASGPQLNAAYDGTDSFSINVIAGGNTYFGWTGSIIWMTKTTSDMSLAFRTSAGQNRGFLFTTGPSGRWKFITNNDAETGSDAGSNFEIVRQSDAGADHPTVIAIERATGKISFDGDLEFVGPQSVTTTTGDLSILPANDLIITPVSTYTKITGTLQFQGAGIVSTTSGNLNLSPAGDLDLSPVGSLLFSTSLIPSATDTYDIGSSTYLWRKGYLSELEALLFVENSIHVEGGWLIVGHDQGTVAEDVDGTQTAIDFGKAMVLNDFVLFRAYGQVEYMKIGTLVSGTNYNVTRNVDASGANVWSKGSVFLVLGNTGDGRIELVANQADSPRISLLLQESTYNAQIEYFRAGNLRDSYSIGSTDTYGVGIGRYEAGYNYIVATAANGIEFFDNASVRVAQLTGEAWTIGQVDASHKHIQITADAIQFKEDATVYGSLSGTEWNIGIVAGGEYLKIAANAITLYSQSVAMVAIDNAGSMVLGVDGNEAIYITPTGITMTDVNDDEWFSLLSGAMVIGNPAGTTENIYMSGTAIQFRRGTTVYGSMGTDDWIIGRVAAGLENIQITNTAIRFRENATTMGILTGSAWRLGPSTADNVYITTSGVQFMDNGVTKVYIQTDGDVFVGSNLAAAATTYLALFATVQTYNSESMTAGDILIGNNSSGKPNLFWDASATQLKFRAGTTANLYINTTGQLVTGAGNVILDNNGLTLAAGDITATKVKWNDGSSDVSSITAASPGTVTDLYIRVHGGGTNTIHLNTGLAELTVEDTATTDEIAIYFSSLRKYYFRTDVASINPSSYTYFGSDVRMALGLHVGSSTDATPDDIRADADIVAGGGIYAGAVAGEPGTGEIHATNGLWVNETTNSKNTQGLTLNQGNNGDEILSIKAGSFNHGMTATTEYDTYFAIKQWSQGIGGAKVIGWSEGTQARGISIHGAVVTHNILHTSAAVGVVTIEAHVKSSTTWGAIGTNANLCTWRNNGSSRMTITGDGRLFIDDLFDDYKWDEHNDIALITGYRGLTAKQKLNQRWTEWVNYAKPILVETGVIELNEEDGRPFVNVLGLQKLTIDAIRQFYDKQMETNENIFEQLRRAYAKMHQYEVVLLEMGVDPKRLN